MADYKRPITSKEQLEAALEYVAEQGLALGRLVLGKEVTIDTITFFTQALEEFELLADLFSDYGAQSDLTHGSTLYIDSDFSVLGNTIKYLGVRRPDPTRAEAGYVDIPVEDFEALKQASAKNPYCEVITSGLGQSLIEIKHPDLDVRAYAVSADEHQHK